MCAIEVGWMISYCLYFRDESIKTWGGFMTEYIINNFYELLQRTTFGKETCVEKENIIFDNEKHK